METKSRYEVISDLEKQKRELIKERDGLNDEAKEKADVVINLNRKKLDIEKQKQDFELKIDNKLQDIERERKDFAFVIKNTEEAFDRNIEDATRDLEHFKSTTEERKKTINELIKSIDDSLNRFTKIGKSS